MVTKIKEKHLNFKFEDLHFCFLKAKLIQQTYNTPLPSWTAFDSLLRSPRGSIYAQCGLLQRWASLQKACGKHGPLLQIRHLFQSVCHLRELKEREEKRKSRAKGWREVTLLLCTTLHTSIHNSTSSRHHITSCDITWHTSCDIDIHHIIWHDIHHVTLWHTSHHMTYIMWHYDMHHITWHCIMWHHMTPHTSMTQPHMTSHTIMWHHLI